MILVRIVVAVFVLALGHESVTAQVSTAASSTNGLSGWLTNGSAVFRTNPQQQVFDHFLPQSLSALIWSNLIAHTNGKSTMIWSVRTHPPKWPVDPPVIEWNTNCLIRGWKGMTAISPCWEDEGSSGQVPVTALTRRHGYTRGHGMGPDGVGRNRKGKKVWFVTSANKLIEVEVSREAIRTALGGGKSDYTILLFDKDLPASIEPMRVISGTNFMSRYPGRPGAPWPLFKTEQSGHVSAEVPGFTVNTWKAGDSGSPNMLPMLGELVFVAGRSTSGPSREMQQDMDELSRLERLDPKKYQLQWIDVSTFPQY